MLQRTKTSFLFFPFLVFLLCPKLDKKLQEQKEKIFFGFSVFGNLEWRETTLGINVTH